MESLLNIVWLLVSVSALFAGIAHYRVRRERRHALWLVAVALAAIAVLLFPVISVTDDLNPAIFASEDLSKRELLASLANAPAVSQAPPVVFCFALLIGSLVVIAERLMDVKSAPTRSGFATAVANRAPPLPV
jgi:hypothetical protein